MRRLMLLGALLTALGACSVFNPSDQRFVVFFQEWSASLDDGGQEAVTAAADRAKGNAAPVIVTGYADPEGSPQANKDMSRLRAQVVADQLVADGVQRARITVRSAGEVGYALDSQESRRVTITLGAQ
jgi:outer membrane protein OmpA-like peptidoglycan-associated protein